MILIENTVISDDIAEKFFVCDLLKCKGACCVEGDLGAPLNDDELPIMQEIYEQVKPYLSEIGIQTIEKEGVYVKDWEGDYSTPVIEGRECAYAIYDDRNILKCGIEQAYLEGKTEAIVHDWKKPISCHLYPIRIQEYKEYDAVNYHSWHICKPACECGSQLNVPVYAFLKEPLIRKYGEAWFNEVDAIFKAYGHQKK